MAAGHRGRVRSQAVYVWRSVRADGDTKAAGIGGDWTPRELRHSFVSILSDNGVTIETIADLVGYKTAWHWNDRGSAALA